MLLPGECRGQQSLVGYSQGYYKQLDTTEGLTQAESFGYGRTLGSDCWNENPETTSNTVSQGRVSQMAGNGFMVFLCVSADWVEHYPALHVCVC